MPDTHIFYHVPREGRGGGVGLCLSKRFTHVKMIMLRPCPGPTGRCTPVLGRREEGLPRRVQDVRVAKIPEFQKDNHFKAQNKMRGQ